MKTNPSFPFATGTTLQILTLVAALNASAATFTDNNWISMGGVAGADGPVFATVADGAGNVYIGGDFTVVGDVVCNGIAKWNGTNWSALGSGMTNTLALYASGGVRALTFWGGDLYAAGSFTAAGGILANKIARWDGSNRSALGSGSLL